MNKRLIALAVVLLVSFSVIVGGILFIHLGGNEVSVGKLYTFPLSVGEKTYIVTVRSNYSSTPEVYLPEIPENMVEFDFRGSPENAFCNITIPNDLIWGELIVIDKYYIMDKANYIQTSNSTDTSIYFTFNQTALVKHFEVRGTEGVIAEGLSTANIEPQTPHYLAFSSGDESKIFLLSAEPSYGYWTKNDTHMDWFTNGPIIHKGDPVFIINATIRNDYTQNDQNRVNDSNFSHVVFNIVLYDKNGNVIDALQAYPQVDTRLNGHIFTFDSGETASFGVYMSTSNRQIDHYDVLVAFVSSVLPPS